VLASAGECGKGETNSPLTFAMVLENGRPLSRANDHSWREEVAIALMTPGGEDDDDNGRHHVGSGVALGGVKKDLDEGVAGRGSEDGINVVNGEA
jgi:hypothetical protein